VRRRHPSLRPVAGRLLVHAMADPRLVDQPPDRFGAPDWPRSWSMGAAASPAWCAMMRDLGVHRLEIDWGPCAPDEANWGDAGMHLTLHLPLALVAAGRFCAHVSPRGPVDRRPIPCPRPCQQSQPEIQVQGDHGGTVSVVSLGVAEATRIDGPNLQRARRWLASGGGPDRIVVGSGWPVGSGGR